ncbi:hypothetical protein PILCRDRAFT_822490 [Piloderma croceum F 1598]|uniref:Uncharacterized protein n=1 Tax=Piloderma croceum (strain F 1598) TaxID=765440 RepID=A0A0C3BSP5_PILCF|nr:hypothetical protein PILCRDRAFT_822490 [Piloderma croceum F 1598]
MTTNDMLQDSTVTGTQHDCLCTNLTIIIHPQGPGPIVLNVNLSWPGMETVNTVPANAVTGALTNISSVRSAVVISGESDCVDMQGTVLLPQNVQRHDVVDDSATESETESDREYLGLPPLKQKAQKQCAIEGDNIVLTHTGKYRAVDGEELAPDSDPEGTKYSSSHLMAIRGKCSFEGKALQLPAKRRHV